MSFYHFIHKVFDGVVILSAVLFSLFILGYGLSIIGTNSSITIKLMGFLFVLGTSMIILSVYFELKKRFP